MRQDETARIQLITFNVRSIRSLQRLAEFENAFSDGAVRFDIIGLSETRRNGCGSTTFNSGYVLHSSGPPVESQRISNGVAFYLSAQVNKQVDSVRFVSDQIIQLILNVGGGQKIRIIQGHAPHSSRDDDEYEDFLAELTTALNSRRVTHDYVIGDFNAVVGPT